MVDVTAGGLRWPGIRRVVRWASFAFVLALLTSGGFSLVAHRKIDRLYSSLKAQNSEQKFSEDMLVGLPDPAKRYLRHAIQPGAPLASSVELMLKARIRESPTSEPQAIKGSFSLHKDRGFVFKMSNWLGDGWEYYSRGSGEHRFFLFGLLSLGTQCGPDTVRAGIGQMASLLLWLPSALLPCNGTTWRGIDADSAQAFLTIDGEPVCVTVLVDSVGRVRQFVCARWGLDTRTNLYCEIPYCIEVARESKFGQYTVPCHASAGWWYESNRYFPYLDGTIVQARFR